MDYFTEILQSAEQHASKAKRTAEVDGREKEEEARRKYFENIAAKSAEMMISVKKDASQKNTASSNHSNNNANTTSSSGPSGSKRNEDQKGMSRGDERERRRPVPNLSFDELLKQADRNNDDAASWRLRPDSMLHPNNNSTNNTTSSGTAHEKPKSHMASSSVTTRPPNTARSGVSSSASATVGSTIVNMDKYRPVSRVQRATSSSSLASLAGKKKSTRPTTSRHDPLAAMKRHAPTNPNAVMSGLAAKIDLRNMHRLNQNKRDLRTIEEIQMDLKKKKAAQDSRHEDSVSPRRNSQPEERAVKKAPQSNSNVMSSKPIPKSRPVEPPSLRPSPAKPVPKKSFALPDNGLKVRQERTTAATKSTPKDDQKRTKETKERFGDEEYYAKNYSSLISDLFGPRKRHYDDDDDDDDDMEATADDIRREEARSARIARLEDEREEALEQERMKRLMEKKKKLKSGRG